MKRVLFLLLVTVLLLSLFVLSCAAVEGEEGEVAVDTRPEWQILLEEKVYPMITAAISSAITYYTMILPTINKIKKAASKVEASAGSFDGAAGNILQVSASSSESTKAVQALDAKIDQAMADMAKQYEEEHKLLLAGLKMMGIAFSHESELVRNGAAREIMKVEEAYGEEA